MSKSLANTKSDKELIELGQAVQLFIDYGYIKRKQVLMFTFLKGIATGFGIFLGGTILVVVLIWLLGLFQQVPLVSPLVHSVNDSIQSGRSNPR